MEKKCFCSTNPLDTINQEFKAILEAYPLGKPKALIPLLQTIQTKYGYLPNSMLSIVSYYLQVPLGQLYSIITFYNQFRLEPPGKIHIEVCTGAGCYVRGGNDLLRTLEAELGIRAGETSKDKLFTLETVSCLGACALAPVVRFGGTIYGRLQPKDIVRLLREYEARE